MILIKLGGSIITNKETPLSARRKTIDRILNQIKHIKEPKILVHGGGSSGDRTAHLWQRQKQQPQRMCNYHPPIPMFNFIVPFICFPFSLFALHLPILIFFGISISLYNFSFAEQRLTLKIGMCWFCMMLYQNMRNSTIKVVYPVFV